MRLSVGGLARFDKDLISKCGIGLSRKHRFVQSKPCPYRRFMRNWPMIALHKVLCQELPIGTPDMFFLQYGNIVLHLIARHHLMQARKRLSDTLGLRIQRDINSAIPDFSPDF